MHNISRHKNSEGAAGWAQCLSFWGSVGKNASFQRVSPCGVMSLFPALHFTGAVVMLFLAFTMALLRLLARLIVAPICICLARVMLETTGLLWLPLSHCHCCPAIQICRYKEQRWLWMLLVGKGVCMNELAYCRDICLSALLPFFLIHICSLFHLLAKGEHMAVCCPSGCH